MRGASHGPSNARSCPGHPPSRPAMPTRPLLPALQPAPRPTGAHKDKCVPPEASFEALVQCLLPVACWGGGSSVSYVGSSSVSFHCCQASLQRARDRAGQPVDASLCIVHAF